MRQAVATVLIVLHVALGAAEEDFRSAADARIERHRMQDAVLVVHDGEGNPLPDARVVARMCEHAFAFGTQVNARYWITVGDEDPYRRAIVGGDFNTAVLGNGLKWYSWERLRRRANAERAIDWFAEHGLRVRGHTMVWGTDNWGVAAARDVKRFVAVKDREQNTGYIWKDEPRPDYVRRRLTHRIANLGAHFRGRIRDWDVLNEPVSEHWWNSLLDPDTEPHRSQLMAEWFRTARRAAGPGARLAVNEFHILVGEFEEHRAGYETVIRTLLEAEAPLDAIGFQGHFYLGDLRRSPAELYATLERFGAFGLPMFVSEFDCAGKRWGDTPAQVERAQADFLEDLLVACFSHPLVDGFIIWGYWDGTHWLKNAPFYRLDWSEKPSLDVWRRLVRDEWWTETSGTTDAEGRFAFRGFKGRYQVTMQVGRETATAAVVLGDEALEENLHLE